LPLAFWLVADSVPTLSFDESGVMAPNGGGEALVAATYPTWTDGSWWKKATTVTEK
jgi:hypothetical protein